MRVVNIRKVAGRWHASVPVGEETVEVRMSASGSEIGALHALILSLAQKLEASDA